MEVIMFGESFGELIFVLASLSSAPKFGILLDEDQYLVTHRKCASSVYRIYVNSRRGCLFT